MQKKTNYENNSKQHASILEFFENNSAVFIRMKPKSEFFIVSQKITNLTLFFLCLPVQHCQKYRETVQVATICTNNSMLQQIW